MKLEGSFSPRSGWACVRKYLFGIPRGPTAKSAGFGRDLPAGLSSDAARDVDGANFIVCCRYQMEGGGGAEAMEKWPGGTQQRERAEERRELSDEGWRHAG